MGSVLLWSLYTLHKKTQHARNNPCHTATEGPHELCGVTERVTLVQCLPFRRRDVTWIYTYLHKRHELGFTD
jgi:hypothetical protein